MPLGSRHLTSGVPWCFSSQTDSTGTTVLERRYDEIMAKPTASDSGTNSDRTGSAMRKAGMNTDRMHNSASSRGTAVMWLPFSTARLSDGVRPIWTWMFSISTVASSTRMPIASASPPSVMMLIVLPVSHRPHSEPKSAIGMLNTTTITLRQLRRNSRIISPVSLAPIRPSVATFFTAVTTVGDSSNAKLDVHVLRQHALEDRHRLFDVGHHL